MARAKGKATGKDHSRINLEIWGDEDWLDLTPPAQHLYMVLWTSPQLTYCGVAEWHPGRISAKAAGWKPAAVEAAAAELSRNLFIVIDTATEEYLLRSWIKHDGICKSPNLMVSMANARASLASRTLRGVVVHEVLKIKAANFAAAKAGEEQISEGWQRDAVKAMLNQKAIDPASLGPFTPSVTPRVTPDLTPSATPQLPLSRGVGVNPPSDPPPTPVPAPVPFSILQGGVTEQGNVTTPNESDPNTPPPPHCPRHMPDGTAENCGACGGYRKRRKVWDDQAGQRASVAATSRRAAIDACDACDPNGLRPTDAANPRSALTRCDHQEATTHA